MCYILRMPNEIHALERLQKFVARYPNQREAAEALGISQPYLSDLMNSRRDLSDQMLLKLGLKRVVVQK